MLGGVNVPGGKSWTEKWMCFDNSYFQRAHAADVDEDLLRLQTDRAISESPEFMPYSKIYAADQSVFFADYSRAHRKMSELGSRFNPLEGLYINNILEQN